MFLEKYQKHFFLAFEFVAISLFVLFNLQLNLENSIKIKSKVLAYETNIQESDIGFGDLISTPPPPVEVKKISKPAPRPSKKIYLIAAIGDSMVETMGDSLEYLGQSLKKRYPETNFVLYNYGVGGENVGKGLERFDKEFSHLSRHYGPLSQLGADIIIVGSFAYNPFSPHNRDKHWLTLAALIEKAKSTGAKVYVLSEIAPLEHGFGVGVGGVNWPEDLAHTHAEHIIEQLENSVGLASNLGVGLVNVYAASQVPGSKFGKSVYVDSHDGIHPSVSGQILTAEKIASTISLP